VASRNIFGSEQIASMAGSTDHTPGPWRIANCDVHPTEGDDGRRFLDIIAGPEVRSPYEPMVSGFIDCGGMSICQVQHGPREANANLIAASPDLYAALVAAKQELWLVARHQWTMSDFQNWAVVQQINAALTKVDGKARGQ